MNENNVKKEYKNIADNVKKESKYITDNVKNTYIKRIIPPIWGDSLCHTRKPPPYEIPIRMPQNGRAVPSDNFSRFFAIFKKGVYFFTFYFIQIFHFKSTF